MSQLNPEDELELQSLLKQLLQSINDRISSAPSAECAEEILLHLEETDKNFHNYEFVKYLRQYMEMSLGSVVEEEIKNLTKADGQHAVGSGHDTVVHSVTRKTKDSPEYKQMIQDLKNTMVLVVESLINKFEEDQLRREELRRQSIQSNTQYNDCSDSDSSFNQSYTFIRQEQLQALSENLDSSKPKEVRWEALQVLCSAPPSDVLSCESWSSLRKNLCAALTEPELSDHVLQFFAKGFSSSPLNVTREIYTSLAKTVQSSFNSLKIPIRPSGIDVTRPEISRLLKQVRLMNDFQKEVTTFWIRHPEKYMEEIVESTFSLLASNSENASSSPRFEKVLEPIHLFALLDIKATWFKKWMHGHYSRTVVLRLLEKKYKSLIVVSLQECIRYKESCESHTEGTNTKESEDFQKHGKKSVYSEKELEYALFVHSLSILGKLLIYTNGRKLFPVKFQKYKDPVSLTELLVILINILYQHPKLSHNDVSHSDSLSPCGLVMEVLWMLCERTECAADCLHQCPVIETLLAPVIALLSGHKVKLKSPPATLTLIADVLARIANSNKGLDLFLHKKNVVMSNSERTFAAHIIAQFTLKLLNKELPGLSDPEVFYSLCGAFVFVCRQMYNTCEGLQVLRPYGLHKALAAAWKKIRAKLQTSAPGTTQASGEHENSCFWEETILDSLLNFAVTPKGLLLLEQTGAINECVGYMFSRFTKKLQVSRCEKFGYGVMVTQIAATAPGVVALNSSGFVRALVLELWSALECGSEDVRVARPKPTPMDPIDRSCLKSFLSLVNLLSSSQSVWELFGHQILANKSEYTLREMPASITDLIDRLITVNSDAKIHSLFHFEQSHTFGLRLLSVLCCNLDTFLLLESQYSICSMLLQNQRENVAELGNDKGQIILDSLSVERNYVLVFVGATGGPSERILPPRSLQEHQDDPYPWPMVSCFPVPKCYSLDLKETGQMSPDSELHAFLASSDMSRKDNWIKTCRSHYCRIMKTAPTLLSGDVLAELLEKAVTHMSEAECERFFPQASHEVEEKTVTNAALSAVEELGINICLRYGCYLKVLQDDAGSDLALLMKHLKVFLWSQRAETTSRLICLQDYYPGHDWLASSVFLLMKGDLDRALRLLLGLSSLLVSAFVWPARIHASVHVPLAVAESGIGPLYYCTAHCVEMLLKSEVPLVHSAFRISGFTPSQMCVHWLTQCFWNYLDWPEICHYICTCVLLGPDYQVYMCVAVFQHLQPNILQQAQSQQLQVYLKEESIRGFRVSNYLDFMKGLEHKYRNMVLTDMQSVSDPVK